MSDPRLNPALEPENPDNVLARMRQAMTPQAPAAPVVQSNGLLHSVTHALTPAAVPQQATVPRPQPAPTTFHGYEQWHRHIAHAHALTGVPVSILDSVMRHESNGNQGAISPVGAIGLMQLMPGTAHDLGVDPHDPVQNILGGAKYLKQMHDQFGSWESALAGYNAGPGAVQRYKGVPPFHETRNYVRNILADIHQRYGGVK